MTKGKKDYSNAKVYKLINDVDDTFYIGSTCSPLRVRLQGHKDAAKRMDRPVYQHLNSVGWDKVRIILIDDDFPCDNLDQLRREEQSHIDMHKDSGLCLNTNNAHTDQKEYMKKYHKEHYKNNKEQYAERGRKYREEHSEEIAEYNKRYQQERAEEIAEYKKQWVATNCEKLAARNKQYWIDNKERISTAWSCPECGTTMVGGAKSKHLKSKKHQANVKASTI